MDEKTLEHIQDVTDESAFSSCCGASIILEDICLECKEHCTPLDDKYN